MTCRQLFEKLGGHPMFLRRLSTASNIDLVSCWTRTFYGDIGACDSLKGAGVEIYVEVALCLEFGLEIDANGDFYTYEFQNFVDREGVDSTGSGRWSCLRLVDRRG